MEKGIFIIGIVITSIWILISLPFLITLWFLGGNNVFNNVGNAIDEIFDK